ncbi:SGNH/GDSL hydrolase family protein [Lactococcus lactis]|uniref:SGNH/GDSL hydrolase family protein n=1 Tax=Lactococcus lactis TaxID=1358 RepID=UPI001914C3C1|nr:SGNH/GDSL hydrolase family protein [Lactococcus lactis]WDA70074.1 SGNH/GDSL hydrolase family protein [Lactococcus lactis]
MKVNACDKGSNSMSVDIDIYNGCTFEIIDKWDPNQHAKTCDTMFYLSDGTGAYAWDCDHWKFLDFTGVTQSDWTAKQDEAGYIKNKPFKTLGKGLFVDENGVLYVTVKGNVKSDWNAANDSDAEILNKPFKALGKNLDVDEKGVLNIDAIVDIKNADGELLPKAEGVVTLPCVSITSKNETIKINEQPKGTFDLSVIKNNSISPDFLSSRTQSIVLANGSFALGDTLNLYGLGQFDYIIFEMISYLGRTTMIMPLSGEEKISTLYVPSSSISTNFKGVNIIEFRLESTNYSDFKITRIDSWNTAEGKPFPTDSGRITKVTGVKDVEVPLKNVSNIGIVGDSVAKGYLSPASFGTIIGQNTGATIENISHNSATFSKSDNSIIDQSLKIKGKDLVIVQGTDDDWGNNIEIDNGTETSFIGGFKKIIDNIKNQNPNCKIIAVFPTKQLSFSTGSWVDEKPNKLNLKLSDYVEQLSKKCKDLNIDYVDIFDTSWLGNKPAEAFKHYFVEGVHPNLEGQSLIANEVYQLIK